MREGRLERRAVCFISNNQPVAFIKKVLVPQISKKTDSSHGLKVAWFGLSQSVKNPCEKGTFISLVTTDKEIEAQRG